MQDLDVVIRAWASAQSQQIKNREELENRFLHYEEKFKDKPVPRPPPGVDTVYVLLQ